MPDNDREDTATSVPVGAPHPSMEEELPTSITTSPTAAIEQALEEDEPPSEDGPTGIAKAPSKPAVEEEHSPADDDGPTSISRVALDDDWEPGAPVAAGAPPEPPPSPDEPDPQEDGPTGVTKVDLPPPDEVPTGRTARPAGVAVPKPLTQDPEEDSVVTLQKPIPDTKDDDSIVTIQPTSAKATAAAKAVLPAHLGPPKSAPKLVAAVPPPRKPTASDIYDVDDDKTERRDLPSEEINRAIARAKMEPVAISELPDESPTARRADLAITPKAGVRSASAQAVEEEAPELSTETDLGPILRRSLGEDVVRPPFGSEADSVITEPAIDKESRVPHAGNLKHTLQLAPPRTTQQGMPAPPPPRPPEQSLGTDSYTFQGGASELQAVIPMTTSAHKASPDRGGGDRGATQSTVPPPPSSLLLSASGAPSTQSMAVHPLAGYPQAPSSHPQLPSAASVALMPTAPAAFPPGLPPGALTGTIMPANGPPSGRMQIGGGFPPPMGSAPNGLGVPNSTPRGPTEEPRWIVLVLGVLAVCILIPTVLYLVLRSRSDEATTEETPARGVVTIQTTQPKDYPKVERRR